MQSSVISAHRLILVAIFVAAAGCSIDAPPTDPLVVGVTPPPPPPQPAPSPPDTTRAPSVNEGAMVWLANGDIRVVSDSTGAEFRPTDISDAGEVAGMVAGDGGKSREVFVWSESAGVKRIGTVGGDDGALIVTGINSAGTVVGYRYPFMGSDLTAFIGSTTSTLRPLSAESMAANDINEAGTIAANTRKGPFRLSLEELQPLTQTHSECTVATAINDNGDVLGWNGDELYGMGCVPQSWIVWRGTAPPEVITSCLLGCDLDLMSMNDAGVAAGHDNDGLVRIRTTGAMTIERLAGAFASDINDPGDIVGGTKWPDVRPLVWKADGRVIYLPLPPGKTQGRATAINNRGDIVGSVW